MWLVYIIAVVVPYENEGVLIIIYYIRNCEDCLAKKKGIVKIIYLFLIRKNVGKVTDVVFLLERDHSSILLLGSGSASRGI